MNYRTRRTRVTVILACACASVLWVDTPKVHAHSYQHYLFGPSRTSATQGKSTTEPPAAAKSQDASTPRERRAQAYAKLLEGQRHYAGARNGRLTPESLRAAQQAFQQAAELDPTLAEADTALAEIAFFYLDDFAQAERLATSAVSSNRNNLGAHRVLARVHAINSGLFENKLNRAVAEKAVLSLREIVRLDSNDPEALALLGEFHLALGREREAVDAFTRWSGAPAALDGRFYQVLTKGRELSQHAAAARLGEVLLQVGRSGEALSAIRRALAAEPNNQRYIELLGRAIEAGGDNSSDAKNALTELKSLVKANPNNVDAIALLARIEARLGNVDGAVELLRNATAKQSSRDQFTLKSGLAQILTDALRFNEAATLYEEILESSGIDTTLLTSERDKNFATLIMSRIINLRRQAGQADKALAAIERMRALLGSNDPKVDVQYVLHLREQGKRAEALEAARAARQKHPGRGEFVRLEAATLTELGRVDEAATLLRAQLDGGSGDYDGHIAIASVYLEAGRGPQAVESARKALELSSADGAVGGQRATQALLLLSSAQERVGDVKGSEESLRRILAEEPNNATALNNLGYFLVERNERLAEALQLIKRAVNAERTNASFLDSLGWAYFKLGQFEEAERYLTDASRRNPASVTIHEHLGDLHQRRGKSDLARAAWQKALSISVDASTTTRLKAKLTGAVTK